MEPRPGETFVPSWSRSFIFRGGEKQLVLITPRLINPWSVETRFKESLANAVKASLAQVNALVARGDWVNFGVASHDIAPVRIGKYLDLARISNSAGVSTRQLPVSPHWSSFSHGHD